MANTYEQANFRARDDSTALNTDGGYLAAENVNPPAIQTGTANRFRLRFTVGNNNNKAATLEPRLYVDKDGGGYNPVTASSSNVQVTGGVPTDGASIDTQLLGNATQGTWEAEGSYDEGDGAAGNFAHEKQGFTEFEWCVFIVDADVANGNVLTFRVYNLTVGPTTVTNEPAITVSKASTHSYAGTITGAGAYKKQATVSAAGTETPAGAYTKQTQIARGGIVTPAGVYALARLLAHAFAGTITPAGTYLKQARKNVAGTITGTGAYLKSITHSFAGTVTPAGVYALAKTVQYAFAGTITPVGNFIKRAGKKIAGIITPAGAFDMFKARLIITWVRFCAPVAGAQTVSFAGTITGAGSFTKQARIIAVGTVTPAGAYIKQATMTALGAVTPAGVFVLSRQLMLSFAGTITPVGTFFKDVSITVAGSISSAGAYVKRMGLP
jgi:hypothetical protein